MRRVAMFILFVAASYDALPQVTYDSSFHFYYYDQKLSMFESMSITAPDMVWLGDSITDGCEWSELFPGKKILNRGISSDNTFGVLNRLYEITRRRPGKVFIMIGINDISRSIPDSVIVNNYRRIIDSLKRHTPGTKIYFQSLLPTNNEFSDFKNHQNKTGHIQFVNTEMEKLCRKNAVTFINLYLHFTDANGKLDARYTNDGLHLTGSGYKKWKEVLLKGKYL